MRPILLLSTLLITCFAFAQEINQFDENGKRHGKWQKTFEGSKELRYQGQFEHGKEVGLFKYYKLVGPKSKLAATKQFNTENYLAETKFYTSKGKLVSEGMMNAKLYIGEWKYYHKNSNTILTLENYNDKGVLHGKKEVFYENSKVAEALNYNNGKLDGEIFYYATNGTLVKSYIYVNDVLHGYSKHFNSKGDMLIEGAYKNDKKHGVWKFYENGKLVKTQDFTTYSKNPFNKSKKN